MTDLATQEVYEGEVIDLATMPDLPYMKLFTQHRQKVVTEAIQNRASWSQAARLANVQPKALKAWLKHADDWPEGPAGIFARRVLGERAKVELEIFNQMLINGNAKKDFFPLIRALEQLNPEDYTRPTGPGTTVNVQVNNVDKLNAVRRTAGDSPMLTD